jgi:hypothetical protein
MVAESVLRRMGRAQAKPIISPDNKLMGFAALYPSYELRPTKRTLCLRNAGTRRIIAP